jgi:hypothetical protein
MSRRPSCLPLFAALLLAACAAAPAPDAAAPRAGERAVVVVFVAVDCPIANRVLPELRRLADELAPRGVRFVQVYANADETDAAVAAHRADFGLTGPAVRDAGGALAARFGAHVTPEAVVVGRGGRLVYQGRINDQYAAPGVGRPAPTRHDLADALRAYLDAGHVTGRGPAAVGCSVRPSA